MGNRLAHLRIFGPYQFNTLHSGVVVYARADVSGQCLVKREDMDGISSLAMTQYIAFGVSEMVFVFQVSLPFS